MDLPAAPHLVTDAAWFAHDLPAQKAPAQRLPLSSYWLPPPLRRFSPPFEKKGFTGGLKRHSDKPAGISAAQGDLDAPALEPVPEGQWKRGSAGPQSAPKSPPSPTEIFLEQTVLCSLTLRVMWGKDFARRGSISLIKATLEEFLKPRVRIFAKEESDSTRWQNLSWDESNSRPGFSGSKSSPQIS